MRAVSLLLGLSLAATAACAQPDMPGTNVNQIAQESQMAEVNLDLHIQPAILVRFPVRPGADPAQAANDLEDRYNEILVDNQTLNRFIQPADVIIYAPAPPPPKRTRLTRAAALSSPKPTSYAIYVLGRRLILVDAAMAAASGGVSPRSLAIRWAKQFQQSLPQLCWRPPAQSDPQVPADPPLIITTDLTQVGGDTGDVFFRGRKVFTLHGVQSDGKTAIDRAEALSRRLGLLVGRYGSALPADQQVQAQPDAAPGSVTLRLGQSALATLTPADARANGAPSAQALADLWAAALNQAWHP
ncbi:MAG: hypothetical protein JO250_21750 [Armatimonadetes bacterium]|nr:hypothetical protein [Armatimonadota bacterium]